MSYATLDALRSDLGKADASQVHSAAYIAKMLHDVPKSRAVDRMAFILERVAGKRVLEFGASGPLHEALVKVSMAVYGIDRPGGQHVISLDDRAYMGTIGEGVYGFDLDDVMSTGLPRLPGPPDVIVCGEVLEHLSNPGWFLTRLKRQYPSVPVLITVPNAFTRAGLQHIVTGVENVNCDHVSWYSYTTLRELLRRAEYAIGEFYWYNGSPYTAEGLIVVTE